MDTISPKPEDPAGPAETGGPPADAPAPADRLARHEPFVKDRVKRTLGRSRTGPGSASDLAQDAWVAALEAQSKGKGPGPSERAEAAWLWTIVRNKINEAFRRARAEKHGGAVNIARIEGDEIPGSDTSPSSLVSRATRNEVLNRAMQTLGPRDRSILTLLLVEGKSRKEIAAILNVGERQVGNLYRGAMERLRAAYLEQGGPLDFS